MNLKIFLFIVGLLFCFNAMGWEPSQASARKVSLQYDLFLPFGNSEITVEVDDNDYIQRLSIETEDRAITIPADALDPYRHPVLADIEIMHYGEKDKESGLGGTFSLCIPYGTIDRIESRGYWQRPVLVVFVTPSEERIRDIPLPNNNTFYSELNGCEIAGLEVYGF